MKNWVCYSWLSGGSCEDRVTSSELSHQTFQGLVYSSAGYEDSPLLSKLHISVLRGTSWKKKIQSVNKFQMHQPLEFICISGPSKKLVIWQDTEVLSGSLTPTGFPLSRNYAGRNSGLLPEFVPGAQVARKPAKEAYCLLFKLVLLLILNSLWNNLRSVFMYWRISV